MRALSAIGPGFIGWIDLTPDDISSTKKFLDSFRIEDTIDALGFQAVSDVLADKFYPAVTTPMTRARYFLFVPAVYRILEERGSRKRDVKKEVEAIQIELRRVLMRTEGKGHGVIGEKREDLDRFPSAVYWSALRKLEIFTSEISEIGYQHEIVAPALDALVSDDGPVTGEEERPVRWGDLPLDSVIKRNRSFSRDLTFGLTVAEAAFLRRRFIESDATRESLVALRLRNRDGTNRRHVWVQPEREFRTYLHHAERFSAASRGASYVYEALVSAKKHRKRQRVADLLKEDEGFAEWWGRGRALTCNWKVEEFRDVVNALELVVTGDDVSFLRELQQACRGPKAQFVARLTDPVTRREVAKRPTKSRLKDNANARLVAQWTPTKHRSPVFLLPYRHRAGQTILRDILRLTYVRS